MALLIIIIGVAGVADVANVADIVDVADVSARDVARDRKRGKGSGNLWREYSFQIPAHCCVDFDSFPTT